VNSDKKKFVISIYGPLGGQGTSFIACQLVHQLARSGLACLIDLNLDYSTSLHYLNLKPSEAFRKSALSSGESVLLSSFAIKVEDNYFAVGSPLLGYGQFAEETAESVQDLFELCRGEFDYSVIDLPRPLHVELTKAVLKNSDLILAISENTEHSARACLKLQHILTDASGMSVDARKLVFLFNNSVTQTMNPMQILALQVAAVAALLVIVHFFLPGLFSNPMFIIFCVILVILMAFLPRTMPTRRTTGKALAILEKKSIKVFHQLPHDSESCRWAINQGKFLGEKTQIGKSISELSEKIKQRLK
jgi:cellulose biosynthesis protein BcsQ